MNFKSIYQKAALSVSAMALAFTMNAQTDSTPSAAPATNDTLKTTTAVDSSKFKLIDLSAFDVSKDLTARGRNLSLGLYTNGYGDGAYAGIGVGGYEAYWRQNIRSANEFLNGSNIQAGLIAPEMNSLIYPQKDTYQSLTLPLIPLHTTNLGSMGGGAFNKDFKMANNTTLATSTFVGKPLSPATFAAGIKTGYTLQPENSKTIYNAGTIISTVQKQDNSYNLFTAGANIGAVTKLNVNVKDASPIVVNTNLMGTFNDVSPLSNDASKAPPQSVITLASLAGNLPLSQLFTDNNDITGFAGGGVSQLSDKTGYMVLGGLSAAVGKAKKTNIQMGYKYGKPKGQDIQKGLFFGASVNVNRPSL